MTRVAEKPDHPALGHCSSSLLWSSPKREGAFDPTILNRLPLPMPGAPDTTLGEMAPHTAIVGTTGAGKTILFKHFMRGLLPAPFEEGGLRFRALIYDPKRELFPYLSLIGIPNSQIIVTHPFDARSASWDLAADFTEPAQIEELAELIVPKSQRSGDGEANQFFESSARIIVQDLIEGFTDFRPGRWELRDVVEALLNLRYLKAVLFKTSNGRDTWDAYLEPLERERDDRTAKSMQATLHTYARPLQAIASLWYKADKRFSLEQWHRGSGVLLLGADPRRERTLQRVNRLLLRRISQLLLGRDDERPLDLTWCFLDEIRAAGKFDGLRQLMTEGRSKGARVVMGFQDIAGLYSLYGEHEAEEMVGLCGNVMLLHLDNAKTRKWASEFMGEEEYIATSEGFSLSRSKQGRTMSESSQQSIQQRKNVLPFEFHEMPLGSPARGVPIWFSVPGRRNEAYLDPTDVQRALMQGVESDEPPFDERPAADQARVPWTEEDLEGLDLTLFKGPDESERKGARSGINLGSLAELSAGPDAGTGSPDTEEDGP